DAGVNVSPAPRARLIPMRRDLSINYSATATQTRERSSTLEDSRHSGLSLVSRSDLPLVNDKQQGWSRLTRGRLSECSSCLQSAPLLRSSSISHSSADCAWSTARAGDLLGSRQASQRQETAAGRRALLVMTSRRQISRRLRSHA